VRWLAVACVAACSVPPLSLEGKQCPCDSARGYVCDELTNRCLATNDGGGIIDTPAATQCTVNLGGETELYRYAGMFDWVDQGGTWSGTETEIRQGDKMASAFAYRTAANLGVTNVRVISSMREIDQGNGGMPSIGITIRTTLDGSTRYRCMWSSGMRRLAILRDDTILGQPATVPADAMLPATFTMEARAVGGTMACCIRELSTARVDAAMDSTIASGYPGLEAERKSAGFGSFVVFGGS
jgi:hypothetical protein